MKIKKRYIVLGVLAVAAVAAYVFTPSIETIVKKLVNKYGSQVTGTEVNLGGFNLSLTNGTGKISSLTVGNPKGYKSANIISLGEVSVKVNLKSLTTDTIIIDEINVKKPIITYEMLSLTQNNIKELQNNISNNTASAAKEEKAEAAKGEEGASKKVVIKVININDGEIQAVTSVPGGSAEVKLPNIQLTGIGEDKQNSGENIAVTISKILNKVLATASETVVKSGLNNVKAVAEENLNNVVGDVKDRVKSLGIFGK